MDASTWQAAAHAATNACLALLKVLDSDSPKYKNINIVAKTGKKKKKIINLIIFTIFFFLAGWPNQFLTRVAVLNFIFRQVS